MFAEDCSFQHSVFRPKNGRLFGADREESEAWILVQLFVKQLKMQVPGSPQVASRPQCIAEKSVGAGTATLRLTVRVNDAVKAIENVKARTYGVVDPDGWNNLRTNGLKLRTNLIFERVIVSRSRSGSNSSEIVQCRPIRIVGFVTRRADVSTVMAHKTSNN